MVKSKENASEQEEKSEIWSDPRFSHLVSDPRFKNLPKSERKVKIDKRFESMFKDKKFKVKYTVDKYGRRVNKTSSEDLKKYYDIGSSDDEEEEEKEKREEEKRIAKDDNEPDDVDENDALQSDGEVVPMTLKERLLDPNIDYARGEGRLISDSSSDEESSEDEDEELFIEHVWGELDRDAETTEESTKRLAVCNMDWDRIRAADIMVACSSFLPPGGSIISVSIYPSEFGKQRMAEEEKYGPPELTKKNQYENSDSDEELVKEQDSEAEEGDDYHMEKLRQYQLNRLKYYYAVIVCDSVATADKIYQECDGIEYESSATKLDLRFIPDDTSFDEDEPTDVCTALPEVGQYKPRSFTTTALQQATVDLTWDETSLERQEVGDKLLSGKLNEVSDAELRKFVAYSSEEEEGSNDEDSDQENEKTKKIEKVEEEPPKKEPNSKSDNKKKKKDDAISKYKALLQEITEKEEKEKKNKFEMEFSWDVTPEEKKTEDSKEKAKPQTVIEKVLQKRSEKNKRRKEERKKKKKQLNGDESEDEAVDSDKSDDFPDDIDMNDPYFAEEFANGDFPEPKSKKKDKKKKSKQTDSDNEEEKRKAKELELLMDDDEEDKKQHFSLEKIIENENETKSKKKRKKQLKKSKDEINSAKKEADDNFQVNVEDERFKAIFSSHHFNIDPTDSHFKKTKGMEQIIHEKLKRRHGNGDTKSTATEDETQSKRPKKMVENSMLVKSLKRKLQQQQSNGRK